MAEGLGEFMGRTHAATHGAVVTPERAESLRSRFENRAMRDVQLEFVFTKVIMRHDPISYPIGSPNSIL